MKSSLYIVRDGWKVVEILSSVEKPEVALKPGEALFEVPAEFEGVVGDDVRFFEDSGRRKPNSKLVAEDLVKIPEGWELVGEDFRIKPRPKLTGVARLRAEIEGFFLRLRWIVTGR
jgi:hypothetical protein